MKTIVVMRHAKAKSKSPTINDFDRRLKRKGKRATRYIAKTLTELNINPDVIISSPAVRALKTAQILAESLNFNQNILIKRKLYNTFYNSKPYSYREIVEDIIDYNNESNTAIIVGHNPDISYLLQVIDCKSNDVLETSSAVVYNFDTTSWKDVITTECIRRCRIDKK